MRRQSLLIAAAALLVSSSMASAQNQTSQDQTSAPTEFQSSTRNKPAIVTIPEAATDTPGVPVSQTSGSNLSLAGRSARVSATTRLAISAPSGGMREVRRIISLVPTPSALNRTISARQTCLCGALRSRTTVLRRRRSTGLRKIEIPVRMRQTCMQRARRESLPGFKCQI